MSMIARDANGAAVQAIFLGATQTVAAGVASANSTAMGAGTTVVRLYCTVDCFIAIGDAPTASSSTVPLTAKVAEYFAVKAGQIIAVIRSSDTGTLYITEAANVI